METHTPANTTRIDPYKNFKFRIVFNSKPVAGISKVSGLKRTTEVIKHRNGGDPSSSYRSPGQTEYDPIILENGITQDLAFSQWLNTITTHSNTPSTPQQGTHTASSSTVDSRRDIVIELYNEAGQVVQTYNVRQCWVSQFSGIPDLDANANTVSIQSLQLENEGWESEPAT